MKPVHEGAGHGVGRGRVLAEKTEPEHRTERRQELQIEERLGPFVEREIVVVVGRGRDGDAFDTPRIGDDAAPRSRHSERPCPEAARYHMRQLVTQHRVRIGRSLDVNLTPPRLGDVRARGAHQAPFFAFVCEQERGHARRALGLEVCLVGAQFSVAIAREQQRVAAQDAARIFDVATRSRYLLPERRLDRRARAEVPQSGAIQHQRCAAERRREPDASEPSAFAKASKRERVVEMSRQAADGQEREQRARAIRRERPKRVDHRVVEGAREVAEERVEREHHRARVEAN